MIRLFASAALVAFGLATGPAIAQSGAPGPGSIYTAMIKDIDGLIDALTEMQTRHALLSESLARRRIAPNERELLETEMADLEEEITRYEALIALYDLQARERRETDSPLRNRTPGTNLDDQ